MFVRYITGYANENTLEADTTVYKLRRRAFRDGFSMSQFWFAVSGGIRSI